MTKEKMDPLLEKWLEGDDDECGCECVMYGAFTAGAAIGWYCEECGQEFEPKHKRIVT
jgi:hypothetical protein